MNWFRGAVGGDCAGHQVAYSAGFEGAGWLEIFEFEVDVAGYVSKFWNGGGRGMYQPASRERAAERMQGVWIQGFWVGGAFEPIVGWLLIE